MQIPTKRHYNQSGMIGIYYVQHVLDSQSFNDVLVNNLCIIKFSFNAHS